MVRWSDGRMVGWSEARGRRPEQTRKTRQSESALQTWIQIATKRHKKIGPTHGVSPGSGRSDRNCNTRSKRMVGWSEFQRTEGGRRRTDDGARTTEGRTRDW